MIKVGLGQAEGLDTQRAIQDAISHCRQQLEGYEPQAGIVFAGVEFNHRQMLDEINRNFPEIDLIGCTTAGEFSSSFGFSDNSMSLMVFYSDDVEIRAGVGQDLSQDPEAAVKSAISLARQRLSQKESLCLAFPDAFNKSANIVIDTLNEELGSHCPVFGGCAARQSDVHSPILQFYRNQILEDSIPLLLIAGPIEYAFSIANSWKPVGKPAKVTEAEGRIVKRIGDFRALDFYYHYLGEHSDPAIEFPLAVYEDDEHFYLRAPIRYDINSRSVTFTEMIPQGATVQLTEAIRDVIVGDTEMTTNTLTSDCSCLQPAFAAAFSCSLRKEALGTRTSEELQILQRFLPPHLPVIGFYGYGEISPLVRGQQSFFHNATLVTVLLGTRDQASVLDKITPQSLPRPAYQAELRGKELPEQRAIDSLKEENEFLRKKLARSEAYRKRLEDIKELNTTLHRKIIQEIDTARREIQLKEVALRKSEEKYRRIVETAGEGFLLMDEDLVITDVNDAYCNMIGYSRAELIGKTPFDLATEEYRQFLLLKKDELLSREYRKFEGAVVARDGRHVPILVHGSTLRDDQGAVIGNMAFVTDMTEHKKSLELAGEVQKSLLPQENLRIRGLDIAGRSIPCEEIGGDYFDYLWGEEYSGRPFGVVVGDIAGHGVDAALLMTAARTYLRMRASQPGDISQIVTEMNRHLTLDTLDAGRFMTLFYMTIDHEKKHLRWVRAGHDPAIIYDPVQDKFEELKGNGGLPLGVDEKSVYEEYRKAGLDPGQIIVIGTDGIWEACNRHGEMFGKDRFREIIRRNANAEANEILNAVYSELDSFTLGLKPEDDITLVVMRMDTSS